MIILVALSILLCVTFALGLVIGNAVVLRWALFLWAVPTVIVGVPVVWLYLSSVLAQLEIGATARDTAVLWANLGGVASWLVLTFSMIALAGLWTGHRMASRTEASA